MERPSKSLARKWWRRWEVVDAALALWERLSPTVKWIVKRMIGWGPVVGGAISGLVKGSFGAVAIGAASGLAVVITVVATGLLSPHIRARLLSAPEDPKTIGPETSAPTHSGDKPPTKAVVPEDASSPPLSVTVERSRTDSGFNYVLRVRNKTLSLYDVSAKVTFLYGSEAELTQLTQRERKELIQNNNYWLPVSGTNDVRAPLESGAYSVRFAFARQHQQMFQLCTVDRSGYFSPTGGLVDTAISPDNGKTIPCEVEFILSSLGQHDTEKVGCVKRYTLGWDRVEEQPVSTLSVPDTEARRDPEAEKERYQRIADALTEKHDDGFGRILNDGYAKAEDLIDAPISDDREWLADMLKDMEALGCTKAEIQRINVLGMYEQKGETEDAELDRLRSIFNERLVRVRSIADTYQSMAHGITP